MLKPLTLFVAFLSTGCAFTGIRGSGSVLTKDIPSGAFDRVQIDNSFHVDVMQGPGYSLSVSADDNLWDYVDIYNYGGILHVGMKSGNYQNTHLSAKIVLPRLTAMEANGASSVLLHSIDDPDNRIELRVGGASSADGDVRCREILIAVTGAGTVTLRGGADRMTLDADGASHAHLEQFRTRTARARIADAADATILVTAELEFEVSGAAHFTYAGHPMITRAESSGAATVHGVR
jgi:hypothetical protein